MVRGLETLLYWELLKEQRLYNLGKNRFIEGKEEDLERQCGIVKSIQNLESRDLVLNFGPVTFCYCELGCHVISPSQLFICKRRMLTRWPLRFLPALNLWILNNMIAVLKYLKGCQLVELYDPRGHKQELLPSGKACEPFLRIMFF